jgi:protein phosphatase
VSLSLDPAVRSEIGHVRSGNEDSAFAGPRLLAVADGMGGHAAGEVASRVAIRALAPLDDDEAGADIGGLLREALSDANDQLRTMSGNDRSLRGMGTTVTAMLASGRRLGLAHIGDSRAYLLRAGELTQITRDHTYVQELVDAGEITADEAGSHPKRNMLMRALDGGESVDAEVRVREAMLGDRYLLCSDGLTGVISDETLASVLRTGRPAEAADKLVELALKAGGPDNITVVVADVVELSSDDVRPMVAGAAALDEDHPKVGPVARLSAAGRAALTRTRKSDPDAPDRNAAATLERPAPRLPRLLRPALVVPLVFVLILALAAGGTLLFVRSQWYVGVDNGRVAVFRGVQGSVLGVHLQHVEDQLGTLAGLSDGDRHRVIEGISATSRDTAERIAHSLLQQPSTTG